MTFICLFLVSLSSVATRPHSYSYFQARAKILNSVDHSGYRKRIYEDAQSYRAFYDVRAPERSIWYPADSKDLHISLLFADRQQAHDFLVCLINYNSSHILLKERIAVDKQIESVESDTEAVYVYKDEYVFEASDSPANTRDDIQSTTEIVYSGDPVFQLRSLEDLSQLAKGEAVYRCHIAPRRFFEDFKNDRDNILMCSHLFHTYFDGDGKRRPAEAHASWGTAPRLMVQYESTGPDHMFQGVRYYMMNVLVSFEDPEIARAMDGRWREGTTADGDLSFHTHFFTTNVDNAKKYLAIKKKETETRWKDPSEIQG